MKKLYLALAVSAGCYVTQAQTLITYGNSSVSKDEFWRAYNKNKQAVPDKEKSLREYLDLYSNFKLKVKAAQDLRLDTLQQLKYDVENFRNQIMENYLSDERGFSRLQQEAFDRSQRDIHLLHFSIPANTADSLVAEKAIRELYSQLQSGKTSEDAAIAAVSGKYAQVKKSDLGYITAFTLPYEYENLAYNLKPGDYSAPYRSKASWHIFKLVEQKPATGKWKVAQILFSFPPDASPETRDMIRRKADSVYNLLHNGMAFGKAAKEFSDDKITFLADGELPEFTSGKYSYPFESEVFKLKKDGEISRPFTTDFGYHIVKRIGQVPVVSDKKDEAYQFELKQKILADARINIEKEKFAREIVNMTGFRLNGNVKEADLMRYADTLMKEFSEAQTKNLPISKKVIAQFSDKTPVLAATGLGS